MTQYFIKTVCRICESTGDDEICDIFVPHDLFLLYQTKLHRIKYTGKLALNKVSMKIK